MKQRNQTLDEWVVEIEKWEEKYLYEEFRFNKIEFRVLDKAVDFLNGIFMQRNYIFLLEKNLP